MTLQKRRVQKEPVSKCNRLKTCMQDGEMALSQRIDGTGRGRSDARFTRAREKPRETGEPWSEAATLVPLPCAARAASRTSRAGA